MATIVNLRSARKAKIKANARVQSDANAVKFGRSKAQTEQEKTLQDKAARDLDGHRRE